MTIRDTEQWVVWRSEDGRKIPYTGVNRRASVTDAETWLSHKKAKRLASGDDFDGIGFVFSADGPYFGVDLDGCIDPDTGEVLRWAGAIIDRLDTYTELSPSGTGVHIIGRGRLPPNVRHKVLVGGEVGGKKSAIEAYDRGRYFTWTGDVLGDRREPMRRHRALDEFVSEYLRRPQPKETPSSPSSRNANVSDEELIDLIAASPCARTFHRLFTAGETLLRHSESESDYELAVILAEHVGGDVERVERLMRRSALRRDKWDRPDYLDRTIRAAILRTAAQQTRPGDEVEHARFLRFDKILADPHLMTLPEPLVPFSAWRGQVTLVAGREKWAGKSTFLAAGAAALTGGRAFLASHLGPMDVLWVSADQEHWGSMALRHMRFFGDPERMHGLYPHLGASVDDRLDELEVHVRNVRPAWVIIDTLTTFALVRNPWQPGEWVGAIMRLKQIAQRYETAITVTCHTPKDREDEYYGSVAIGGSVDQLVTIQNLTKDVQDRERYITSFGRLGAGLMTVELIGDEYREVTSGGTDLDEEILAAVRDEPGLSQKKICNAVKTKKERVLEAVKGLVARGALKKKGGPQKHSYEIGEVEDGDWFFVTDQDFAKARAMTRANAFN